MSGELATLARVRAEREQTARIRPLRRRRRLGPGKQIKFGAAIGPVLLLAIWSIGSAVGWLDPRILSAPWTVVTTTGELISDGRLQSNLWT
jgi:sulfonate transport system permease protein